MFGIVKKFIAVIRLYLMRRNQFDNPKLRAFFRERYDIDVGTYSYGCFDRWRMPGPMRIGRYCSIGNSVRRAERNHPLEAITTHPALYDPLFGVVDHEPAPVPPLVIEDDVWIGHNVMILPNVLFIGRGAVIGAGSVVTKNVDPYTVVVGNPARKIRDRFTPEMIAQVEASRWWELSLGDLRKIADTNPDLLNHPNPSSLAEWTGKSGN